MKSISFIPVVLFAFVFAAANANAQAIRDIPRATLMAGVIDTPGAIHYYRFTANAGDVVSIETLAQRLSPASRLDTVVSLLTSDLGRVLATNDDIALGSQTDSLIWFTIPSAGNFVIRVQAFETFIETTAVGGADYRYQVRWDTTTGMRTIDLAQLAEGDAINTSIILTNPSTAVASGSVNLFADDGSAFMSLLEQHFSSSFRFTLPPRGSLRLNTTSTTPLRVGWAELIMDNPAVTGNIIFIGRYAGRTLIEAGVCPADLGTTFIAFVDSVSPSATGLGIANPGTRPATVSLSLRDTQGNPFGQERTVTLAPLEHTSQFIHEIFAGTAGIQNFRGTVTATANASAVAAVALKFDNPDLSALTTVPVLAQAGSTTTYFPQIANGANYFRTNIVIVNSSPAEASGQLRVFQSDGSPFELPLTDGRRLSTISVQIPPRGAIVLTSTGEGSLQAGWAVLTTNIGVAANAIFQTVSGSRVLSEAGVSASRVFRRFAIFADTIGTARTGIAIANASASTANIRVRLFDRQGVERTTSPAQITLGPNQHISRFIDEILSSIAGITEFEGTALFESDADVSAVSLRLDNFDLSVFTTLCVTPAP